MTKQNSVKKERVIAYIDGFNLYFGLKSKGWRRYYWLNLQALMRNLIKPYQVLIRTKYFTARISKPHDKQKRQTTYIEALGTLSDFDIFFGKYQLNPRKCKKCNYYEDIPSEKMTDVNIAVELMSDAFLDHYDVAYLLSADSDLTHVITRIRSLFPEKKIVVAFPPERHSKDLENRARFSFTIGRAALAKSLFPLEVKKPDGYVLSCPDLWINKKDDGD